MTTAARILEFTAENVKRLTFVEIDPDPHVQVIAGANGQGKSSVLDAIWLALGGRQAAADIPNPIREGQDTAFVELNLGDLIVTRTWERGKRSEIIVTNADGVRQQSPAAIIDSLVGRFSFDPLKFVTDSPADQVNTLLSVTEFGPRADGSTFDLAEIDRERADAFQERKEARSARDQMQHRIDGMVRPPEGTPAEPVSAAKLLAQVDDITTQLAAIVTADARLDEARRAVTDVEYRVEQARAELADAERELAGSKITVGALEAERRELPEPPPLAPLREQIENVDQVNADVRAAQALAAAEAELAKLHEQFIQAQGDLEDIDDEKREALEQAQMPVDGLSFDEDDDGDPVVRYNGVRLGDVATSEAIKIGVAMAMALNPDLRVIHVKDGSLLDSQAMATLRQMAVDHDYQCWVEVVDESGQQGLVIEDGTIRS